MAVIRTVLGDIAPEELGVTLMHEHLALNLNEDQNLDNQAAVLDELGRFAKLGGNAVVEVTNIGMGRNVGALESLSRQSGLHILASTGFYFSRFYPDFVRELDAEELAALMIEEITVGIDGTDIRAGLIAELGTGNPVEAEEAKVFRAAALAQQQTGAAISTHTPLGQLAPEQAELLVEAGVRPERIIIGHVDLVPELDYHLRVAETGCFVQYDTFGKEQFLPDAVRLHNLLALLAQGYEDQVLLSSDVTRYEYFAANGGFGYWHVLNRIVPALKEAGVADAVIRKLLVDNPARALSFGGL